MEEDNKLKEFREIQKDDNVGEWYAKAVQSGTIPSFEQFKKNPEIFRQNKENVFAQIDQGQTLLKNLRDQVYFFKTRAGIKYDCGKSLNRVAEIAKEEGLLFSDLKPYPEVREDVSAKVKCEITFCPPGVTP